MRALREGLPYYDYLVLNGEADNRESSDSKKELVTTMYADLNVYDTPFNL